MALELSDEVASLLAWCESDTHFGSLPQRSDDHVQELRFGTFDDDFLAQLSVDGSASIPLAAADADGARAAVECSKESRPETTMVQGFRFIDPAAVRAKTFVKVGYKAARLASSLGMVLGDSIRGHFQRLVREREVFLGREEQAIAYQFAAEVEHDEVDHEDEESSVPTKCEPVKPHAAARRRTRREKARLRFWVRKAIMHFPLRPNTEAMRGTVFKWVSSQMCESGWSTGHAFAYAWLVAGLAIAGLEEERLAREITRPRVSWLGRLLGYGGAPATGG